MKLKNKQAFVKKSQNEDISVAFTQCSVGFKVKVVLGTDLAGYPAAVHPANNYTGYQTWPDTEYPAKKLIFLHVKKPNVFLFHFSPFLSSNSRLLSFNFLDFLD